MTVDTNKILNFNASEAIAEAVTDSKHTASTYLLSTYLRKIPELQAAIHFDELSYRATLDRDVTLIDDGKLSFKLPAGDWQDANTVTLKMFLEYSGVKLSKADLDDVIEATAYKSKVNPFKEWVKKQATTGTYDPEVYKKVMVDWLQASWDIEYSVAWIKSLMGAIYHNEFFEGPAISYSPVPARYTLFGPQGIGKTLFFRELVGGMMGTLQGSADLSNKDTLSQVASSVITTFDDTGYSGKTQYVDGMKSLITQATLSYRPPYGRRDVTRLNRSVFTGSTNRAYVFSDTTGNRREYPIDTAVGMSKEEARKHGMSFYKDVLKGGKDHSIIADLWKTFLEDSEKDPAPTIFEVDSELDNARIACYNAHCRTSELVAEVKDLLDTKVYDTIFTTKNISDWDRVSYLLGEDVHGGQRKVVNENTIYTAMVRLDSFSELPAKPINATIRRMVESKPTLSRIQSAMYDLGGYKYKRTNHGTVYTKK